MCLLWGFHHEMFTDAPAGSRPGRKALKLCCESHTEEHHGGLCDEESAPPGSAGACRRSQTQHIYDLQSLLRGAGPPPPPPPAVRRKGA